MALERRIDEIMAQVSAHSSDILKPELAGGPVTAPQAFGWLMASVGATAEALEAHDGVLPAPGGAPGPETYAMIIASVLRPESLARVERSIPSRVIRSVARYPGRRAMLMALAEEAGELGRALTARALRYPKGHKKHATSRQILDECCDVAVVAIRIRLHGDDDFRREAEAT